MGMVDDGHQPYVEVFFTMVFPAPSPKGST